MSLFLKPPAVDPRDYLSSADAAKVAAIRLTSPPGYWDDEIRQTLMREHPYIPADRVIVNFSQKDDASGTAFGYISIAGSPTISIPVVIKNRELAPLDVMIVRSTNVPGAPGMENVPAQSADEAGGDHQGSGDMTDDKVLPLNEDTFASALDAGQIGDVVPPHKMVGTSSTEDGSALRLPMRGRTVLASFSQALGADQAQKDKLGDILSKNAQAVAGFIINKTGSVVDAWLSAPAPKNSVQEKLASVAIERGSAIIANEIPAEIKSAEILAADIFIADETTKTAVAFDALDLANPEAGPARYFAFEDGTYCRAPEKVAGVTFDEEKESQAVSFILSKIAAISLRNGQTLVFASDPIYTAPAKLANVIAREDQGIVELSMLDGMNQGYKVLLDNRIKVATRDDSTGTWIMPFNTKVLALGDHAELMPLEPVKVASAIERNLTDALIHDNGQFTVIVRGNTFGQAQISEAKVAALLDSYIDNSAALIEQAKEHGLVRFGSNIPTILEGITQKVAHFKSIPGIAREALQDIAIPMEKAVKLAAGIGDPDGVDAVLGAGFLTEDNLAEFVNLADQFEETVGKLARLLLAIRMGFPGDETATVVAMKSLARVAERLQSAGQEV
jgi:hypothetical protein